MNEQLRLTIARVVEIPDPALVLLVGAACAGKSTFAARHFAPNEVVSSDAFRAIVSGDESDQSASQVAFELLHAAVAERLGAGRLTVVDATSVNSRRRAPFVDAARRFGLPAVAIVLDLRERLCLDRNEARPERSLPRYIVRAQVRAVRRSLPTLRGEGFARVHILRSPADVDTAVVERKR